MEKEIASHLQDSILLFLIIDDDFAKQASGQLQSEFFNSEVSQLVFGITRKYIQKYKKAPGKHFQDELLGKITGWDDDKRELIARYLDYLQNLSPNKDYVLSKLNEFVLQRTLIDATYKFADMLENERYDEAISMMQKSLRAGVGKQETGTDYFEGKDIQDRKESPERLMKIGISYIDKYVRLQRGDLVAIAGVQKGGKSFFCHYIGVQALLQGLNVLHVSHENSLMDCLKRYDMMVGRFVDAEEPQEVETRYLEDGIIKKEMKVRDTIYNTEKVLNARKKLLQFGGGLRVKKFPMGMCSPNELYAYMENLESFHDFKIDVVINDYADIMKPFDIAKQTRDSINEIYMFLKGIADDKQLLMITPTQINDAGATELEKNHHLSGNTLSEDRRKFANIDRGFYVGEIEEENENGFKESIVGCFANRNGPQPGRIVIGQNLRIGAFKLYSFPYSQR